MEDVYRESSDSCTSDQQSATSNFGDCDEEKDTVPNLLD